MHLSPEFDQTVKVIKADGFEIGEQVEMLLSSDTSEAIGKSMGLGLIGFSQAYARRRPDVLLVLGDRFEMHSAALAALPFKIPVAHVHGGELTLGAIDDALRHSITKLSHLHFAATEEYARRIVQMGEESWRVLISGAPALDLLHSARLLTREELSERYHLRLQERPLLVTYHPVTLEFEETEEQVSQLLDALRASAMPIVITAPNADTGGRVTKKLMEDFVQSYPLAQMIANLGTEAYWSLMRQAVAMVGNSSSGLIEAPSFGLPVVNIGTRQQGRGRAENVIDVGYRSEEILQGIRKAVLPDFRAHLVGKPNPYGSGGASDVIVKKLQAVSLDLKLIQKSFVDMPASSICSV
jgi:UDP-N-acetylglucosamine 2-epimerase (non-hydrolysing)/GDP/UDP-N,N'-diacetylbacillosamine 2-epimerase (hydrolysing)